MSDSTRQTITIKIEIDIPVDAAESTLRQLQPIVAQIQNGAAYPAEAQPAIEDAEIVDSVSEQRQAEIRAHYDEQKRLFWVNTIQAHRTFRQIRTDYACAYDAYKVIARRLEWPVSLVQSQITRHRKRLKAYVKSRQKTTVLRMVLSGKKHHEIAQKLGVHAKTVGTLYREAKRERGL